MGIWNVLDWMLNRRRLSVLLRNPPTPIAPVLKTVQSRPGVNNILYEVCGGNPEEIHDFDPSTFCVQHVHTYIHMDSRQRHGHGTRYMTDE